VLTTKDPLLKASTQIFKTVYGARVEEIPESERKDLMQVSSQCRGQLKRKQAVGGENFVAFAEFTPPEAFYRVYLWNLNPEVYDRVVFVDLKGSLQDDVDELFELSEGVDFAASGDFFLPSTFNTDVMVVTPDPRKYEEMLEVGQQSCGAHVAPPLQLNGVNDLLYSSLLDRTLGRASFDGTVQGFLNYFYPDWYQGPAGRRLHSRYAAAMAAFCTFEPSWKVLGEKKIVLFGSCVPADPWNPAREAQRNHFFGNEYFVRFYRLLKQANDKAKSKKG